MASDERRFYVRGALTACANLRVTEDVVATVCRELGLTPEDMAKFIAEEYEALKAAHVSKKAKR